VPDWINTEEYPPFEPDLHEDFPTGPEFEHRIPHILHQAYVDNYIPNTFASNIKNFLERNSDWKYFLWTEKSSRKLIIKKYPSLLGSLTLQMNFKDQSEILRYVVLHEFGGVYAEMPLQWLRPLRRITFKYA
jgi:mannosyltransferase OCH1-like enzyme